MPSTSPRPSRREINDERLRDAALAELVDHGADSLGPTAVARRAGLSTGAVYSRFEDTTELLVDLWLNRCLQAGIDLADLALDALVGDGGHDACQRLVQQLSSPTPEIKAAIALVVISHRDEALAEVVIPEQLLVRDRLLVASSADPERRAKVALVMSLVIGWLLLDFTAVDGRTEGRASPTDDGPADDGPDMVAALEGVARSLARSAEPTGEPPQVNLPELPTVEDIDGDPTRAALIMACMDVIARVGLQRATVTRIARKAGLTHGAVYGLFDSKEELVATAVAELTDTILGRDRLFLREQFALTGDLAGLWAAVLDTFSDSRRRTWHNFRLECHLAQLHDPVVAAALSRVYARLLAHDTVLLSQLLGLGAEQARSRARLQLAVPVGCIMLHVLLPGIVDSVDWRYSMGLLG